MCPVEKIEPSPKSYDLIPHPPFMYFNKIMGFHKQKKLWAHHPYHIYLSKKKGRSFYWFIFYVTQLSNFLFIIHKDHNLMFWKYPKL